MHRATIRNQSACADAHAIVAARNSSAPVQNTSRARKRCTRKTNASAVTATAALYDVTIHDTPVIDVSKREYSCGRARTTMDESAKAIATSAATVAPRSHVLGTVPGTCPRDSPSVMSVLGYALR